MNGKQLIQNVKTQKIRYYGHVKRHSCHERTIFEGKVDGSRGWGRPRRQWMDDVTEWLCVDCETAGRLAMDKGQFRRSIAAVTSK